MADSCVPMVPLYAAGVEDLTRSRQGDGTCGACGHFGEVRVEALRKKFASFTLVQDLRLWRTRCGERRSVGLDGAKALRKDRVPWSDR
jgi:hypothetical protein